MSLLRANEFNECNGKCKTAGLFRPKGNTTMWRQSQTNNYRPYFALEATIRKAHANSEQVVSIVFDMEKSYD